MRHIPTLLLQPNPCQPSSFAIAQEMLETANRVARFRGLGIAFVVDIASPPLNGLSAELVLLPGMGIATEREFEDVAKTRGFADLLSVLQTAQSAGATIATACSGCFALAEAGALNGKSATCTWWLAPYMQQKFPDIRVRPSEILIDEGDVITAGAAFSQIDLMLHLIERYMGYEVSEDCRRFLMADSRPSQLPYISVATLVAFDPALQKAELHVRRHIAQPLSIADLARSAGLGERTFARRLKAGTGMTPSVFLQTLRVNEAIRLARTSKMNNDEIAHRVGYSDATALRRTMRKRAGRNLDSFRA